jgi:alternate signal-mediated exported protein
MNKKTKGFVTAAIGASLLLGSAGTFALWYDTTSIAQATVETGTLILDSEEFGWVWTHVSAGTLPGEWVEGEEEGEDVFVPGAFAAATSKIVPGDGVQGTATTAFVLTGDTLVARLSIDSENWQDHAHLAARITIGEGDDAVSAVGGFDTPIVFDGLTQSSDQQLITVEVGFPLARNAAGDLEWRLPAADAVLGEDGQTVLVPARDGYSRNDSISLAGLTLTLTQTAGDSVFPGFGVGDDNGDED